MVYQMHETLVTYELECVDPCAADPCENGGRCMAAGDFEAGAIQLGFYCHCVPGFTGLYCEDGKNVELLNNFHSNPDTLHVFSARLSLERILCLFWSAHEPAVALQFCEYCR